MTENVVPLPPNMPKNIKTIAVIHYQQALQIHTALLVNALAAAGHRVHLFLFEEGARRYAEVPSHENIIVHREKIIRLTLPLWGFLAFRKLFCMLLNRPLLLESARRKWLFPYGFARIKSYFARQKESFDFSIGVEKRGLACAALLHQLFEIPYYYYSLELYLEDHPVRYQWDFTSLRTLEKASHATACGTLIQDEDRARALYSANNMLINAPPVYFLPVSLSRRSSQKRASVSVYNTRKLFVFGMNRMNEAEFVTLAKRLPPYYSLHIHNFSIEEEQKIVARHTLHNVTLSNTFLSEDEIDALLATARIGLCWYSIDTLNERLIAFSSEKVVRYLAQGIPIIGRAESNFDRLFASCACGVTIRNGDDITAAIERIEEDYAAYSAAARAAFERFFVFEDNIVGFEAFIHQTLPTRN